MKTGKRVRDLIFKLYTLAYSIGDKRKPEGSNRQILLDVFVQNVCYSNGFTFNSFSQFSVTTLLFNQRVTCAFLLSWENKSFLLYI